MVMAPKSVLITGCSKGGIGYALAQSFQKRGLRVFASARTPSKMSPLEELPNVTLLTIDVTSSSSIAAAVNMVEKETDGSLDYLVNNAGCFYVMPMLDVDMVEAKSIFDTNFWGSLAMIQAFGPLLISAKGSIVNIGSISSCMCVPWMSESQSTQRFADYLPYHCRYLRSIESGSLDCWRNHTL